MMVVEVICDTHVLVMGWSKWGRRRIMLYTRVVKRCEESGMCGVRGVLDIVDYTGGDTRMDEACRHRTGGTTWLMDDDIRVTCMIGMVGEGDRFHLKIDWCMLFVLCGGLVVSIVLHKLRWDRGVMSTKILELCAECLSVFILRIGVGGLAVLSAYMIWDGGGFGDTQSRARSMSNV
ncbi:hypothetical protein Tco_0749175 [Tanacetum coccineum]|uniref:Transmembrane protein n=1 Tax=Tanacetum coccineum TaxID=301880 RepID=A0ABQ4YXU5_9ASTR